MPTLDEVGVDPNLVNTEKKTKILPEVETLLNEALTGRLSAVALLLESPRPAPPADYVADSSKPSVRLVDETDGNGRSALHITANSGHLQIVEYLVDTAHATVDIVDADNNTPLHYAIKKAHVEIAQKLLDAGANPNARNSHRVTCIHMAAQTGSAKILRALLAKGASLRDAQGNFLSVTAFGGILHFAADSGDIEVLALLLQAGADMNELDSTELTPLHIAVARQHAAIVRALVQRGANVNAQGAQWVTPLHIAASMGSVDIAKILLDGGAKNLPDLDGDTPVSIAEKNRNPTLLSLYEKYDMSVPEEYIPRIRSNELKMEGNAAYGKAEFEKAIALYDEAIRLDSNNYMALSNRSACHKRLNNLAAALADADRVIEISPKWPRGYYRRGTALLALDNKKEAENAWRKGLALEPTNKDILRDLAKLLADPSYHSTWVQENPQPNT